MTLNQCQPGSVSESDERSGVDVSGIHRLVLIPGSMPVKPSRATPTIWYVFRPSVNVRPITRGSLPNRLVQKPWLSTATARPPARSSSEGTITRPRAGVTPSMPNPFPETNCSCTRSSPPVASNVARLGDW